MSRDKALVLLGTIVDVEVAEKLKEKLAEKNISTTEFFDGCINSVLSDDFTLEVIKK